MNKLTIYIKKPDYGLVKKIGEALNNSYGRI